MVRVTDGCNCGKKMETLLSVRFYGELVEQEGFHVILKSWVRMEIVNSVRKNGGY